MERINFKDMLCSALRTSVLFIVEYKSQFYLWILSLPTLCSTSTVESRADLGSFRSTDQLCFYSRNNKNRTVPSPCRHSGQLCADSTTP